MGSLLINAALLGGGFVLGRVPLLPIAAQILDELNALPTVRKIIMAALVTLIVALYVLVILIPLRCVAHQEAIESTEKSKRIKVTSFRRELRRRGSYSMSYVTDVKAHVFSLCSV
ncbi:uncharacterized protein PHALS_12527 [Plasmopara halstedii]|uniref:Uncharacterized protein n=1 Tax=Plasmopara halstedii TaxID=4781 RepID=A0A0P1AN93_PLAHL|nr:uncharacterized protein PHALS_12527 [Plasmopara halstedii]CEG42234.1 hypothetical protein PHALS_12527 [Plasmopara halstedii]|eukprot:XP_024578603.1 hypothetical protein PHALS_12527 [Plasmopara halstedii]